MTTTVTVSAHCGDDKQVVVTVDPGTGHDSVVSTLKNGESNEFTIYDDISVRAKEVYIAAQDQPEEPTVAEPTAESEVCDPAEE